MNKKKRALNTIRPQYKLFVEELEDNPAFRSKKINTKSSNTVDTIWEKLVTKLNACGGPQRGVNAWKRVFIDWKSHVKKKAKLLKVHNRTTDLCADKTLSDLEERLLRIMDSTSSGDRNNLIQPTVLPMQLQDPIVIENSDCIEFVNEEGAIISTTDKLEFTYDGTLLTKNNDRSNQELEGTAKKLFEYQTPDSGFDVFLEDFHQNNGIGSLFKEEILTELKGIKSAFEKLLKELHVQNEINRLRAQIDYEKAKAKYENFNLEIQF